MTARRLDPDALRYARHWEPVLAPAAWRVLDRLDSAPAVLLDLGAGTGSLTLQAAARWPRADIIALDASGAMLGVARARAADLGHDPARFSWLPADARDIPLEEATIDAVVSSFVLQRVEDRDGLLQEVRRVLRPGGTLSFVTWLAADLVVDADQAYDDVLAELGHEPAATGFRSPLSTDYRSPDEARAELSAAGFAQIEVWRDELHARWDRDSYLQLKEQFDDHERFEALAAPERERLRQRLLARWAGLPDEAFEVRCPLVVGVAREDGAA